MGEYLARFWSFTLENWQSEFLHVVLLVTMTAYLIHEGSAESRDSDDRMEAALERVEQRMDRLERDGSTSGLAPGRTGAAHQAASDQEPPRRRGLAAVAVAGVGSARPATTACSSRTAGRSARPDPRSASVSICSAPCGAPAQPGRTFLISVANERVIQRRAAYVKADVVSIVP